MPQQFGVRRLTIEMEDHLSPTSTLREQSFKVSNVHDIVGAERFGVNIVLPGQFLRQVEASL